MTILYWLLVALMVVGVAGSVLPALPGAILILIGVIIWGVAQGFTGLWPALGVAVVVVLANISIDFLATYWGAKKAGASRWGQIGAIVGLLLGIFGLLPALPLGGPLLGILIGPMLGAIVGELIYRRNLKQAVKAGIGIVVGTVIGNLIQGLLALGALGVFLFTTWSQVTYGVGFSLP